jgi:hypothetical protein
MSGKLKIGAFVLVLIAISILIRGWLASHDDLVRLQATLASQKQIIDAADARERDRAANLKDTLAQIDALKQAVLSPAQILSELPKYLSLPQPITLLTQDQNARGVGGAVPTAIPSVASTTASANQLLSATQTLPMGAKDGQGTEVGAGAGVGPAIPSAPSISELPDGPQARIPVADLKPLYDFVQDCRACQAQLAAAKLNAADDATKMTALTQQLDAAINASKGGSIGRRIRRNAVWFLAGAAAGTIATCMSGHCRR